MKSHPSPAATLSSLRLASPTLLALAIGLALGCARFSTKQQDLRYGETGKPATAITTKASSYTLFSSKSALANFKASQTEKTQGATVGSLNQQGATNTVEVLKALAEILAAAPK